MSIDGGGEGIQPGLAKPTRDGTDARPVPPPPKWQVTKGTGPWVWVDIDNQHFMVRFYNVRSKHDVEWYADQFRAALGKLCKQPLTRRIIEYSQVKCSKCQTVVRVIYTPGTVCDDCKEN